MSDRRSVDIAKFNEIDDSWVQTGGLWTRCIFIGKAKSPDSPVGIAIKADREIGDRVAGKRSFGTTTMMVVLSGNVMHDDRWLSAGDFYVSPPNEVARSEEHTSELQSLMRISYAVFCLKQKMNKYTTAARSKSTQPSK